MGKLAVVGAGLVGSLWARMLGNRGHEVVVYERRPDPRLGPLHGGRSINLALSDRGWKALERAGVADQVRDIALPIRGRRMHAVDGTRTFQPYGLEGQCIYSVSRAGLNRILVEAAESLPNVTFQFDHRCQGYDTAETQATLHLEHQGEALSVACDRIFGTDGAFSAIRGRMMRNDRFDFEQRHLPHGYKEVPMLPGTDGEFQMEEDGLHIWPRGPSADGIAQPDRPSPARCLVPMKEKMDEPFDHRRSRPVVFRAALSGRPSLLAQLTEDWKTHPISSLVMTRCFPWNDGSRVALMGDSAHAIVPFYGQGMNSGMEDCTVLDELLDEHDNWEGIMTAYTALRKPAGDAIMELALQNYIEMRDLTGDAQFLRQKQLEGRLQRKHPDKWLPLYSQVTFSHTPYHEALDRGRRQQRVMEQVMADPQRWNHFEDDAWMTAALEALAQTEHADA